MGPTGTRVDVAVVSDRSLVGETVWAALCGRGIAAQVLPWPGARRSTREVVVRRPAEVLLVMSEVRRLDQLSVVHQVLRWPAVHRLALTSAPRGAVWGGLLAGGADLVASASIGLDDLEALLGCVAASGVVMDTSEREELIARWRREDREQRLAAQRLASLTARESQVLHLLHAGQPVRAIADSFAVTEATVRSQVKSLLRKLEVNSQLAAVAVLQALTW